MAAQRRPVRVQYLGMSGSTIECVAAMVTILTSPFPCREITVLFCQEHEHPQPEQQHYAVSFAIWDWLGHDLTIVPDGFGTHAGTGGWGLAVVLELIEYYRIPLKEKWIDDVNQFWRINAGFPTERDIKDLHVDDHWAPSWRLHVGHYGPRLWAHALDGEAGPFPHWLLEPELVKCVRGIERDPANAVFQAAKRLEVIVRQIGGYDATLIGDNLITEAMLSQRARLVPHGATDNETQAWALLFRGAIGAFKNPLSHRDVELSMDEATQRILTVNLLIQRLKADFPEKFPQQHKADELDDDGLAEEEDDADVSYRGAP
jgi:hypothetical protein